MKKRKHQAFSSIYTAKGKVWQGAVRRGKARYGQAWRGPVWRGVVGSGKARCGAVWRGKAGEARHGMVR